MPFISFRLQRYSKLLIQTKIIAICMHYDYTDWKLISRIIVHTYWLYSVVGRILIIICVCMCHVRFHSSHSCRKHEFIRAAHSYIGHAMHILLCNVTQWHGKGMFLFDGNTTKCWCSHEKTAEEINADSGKKNVSKWKSTKFSNMLERSGY